LRAARISRKAREAIGAPVFAADAVMDEEQTGGIVLGFHSAQPRIIRPPEGDLPVAFEKIALRDVGARIRYQFAQFRAGLADGDSMVARVWRIGGMAEQVRIGARIATGDDREREGGQGRRVHRRVAGGGDIGGIGPAEPLVEMQRPQCGFSRVSL
jgi:hypothetical protein